MTAPRILGRSNRDVLADIGVALLQVKCAEKLTLDEIGERLGVTREMVAQYIAGEAEMGAVKWLRAVEAWPELADKLGGGQ